MQLGSDASMAQFAGNCLQTTTPKSNELKLDKLAANEKSRADYSLIKVRSYPRNFKAHSAH